MDSLSIQYASKLMDALKIEIDIMTINIRKLDDVLLLDQSVLSSCAPHLVFVRERLDEVFIKLSKQKCSTWNI